MAPYYYGMSWECGWFRAIVLSILKIWLAQNPHRHFTLQKFEVHKWATFCTVVDKKTWWRARSREAQEKPKQNGWNAWKSLWYGLYWVHAIVPILKILAWPNSPRAQQIPKFEVDIYGATSMLLTTKNLDGGQVSEEPKKKKKQTQIFEENRENNENPLCYGMWWVQATCAHFSVCLEILACPNSSQAPHESQGTMSCTQHFQ